MSDLPPPPVPADADLRDFEYMALEVRVLRDSRFAAQVTGDAFRAGVLLWCAAWHQVPAGSVPDDDIELANLAGYGRFVKEWRKVRDEALIGFVKCSDGRLYHEVVCKKVREALDARSRHAYEKCCDRLRKKNAERRKAGRKEYGAPTFDQWKSGGFDEGIPPDMEASSAGIPPDSAGNDSEGGEAGGGDPPENALIGKGSEGKGELNPKTPDGESEGKDRPEGRPAPAEGALPQQSSFAKPLPPDWMPSVSTKAWIHRARPDLAPKLDVVVEDFRLYLATQTGQRTYSADWESSFKRWALREKAGDGVDRSSPADPSLVPRWWESEKATNEQAEKLGMSARNGEGWPEFRQRIRDALDARKATKTPEHA